MKLAFNMFLIVDMDTIKKQKNVRNLHLEDAKEMKTVS